MKIFFIHIFFHSFFSLLLFTSALYAQQFSVKLYNVNDGLPSTETYSAMQDVYGYLWINSPAGLNRFDGRQFVNYGLGDGLPSLDVLFIFNDSHKRLWVGTSAGMVQFINNRFVTYPLSDSLSNIYVLGFFETKDKKIWALTVKGVYEFKDSVWKKIKLYPGFENKPCRNVIETNGELYINYSSDAIVCRNKEGKWLPIALNKSYGSLFNVMSVQDNKICVSTIQNIFIINDKHLIPVLKKNRISKNYFYYLVDSKKRLWIVGEGFFKISKPNDWQFFPDSIANQYGYVHSIFEDSSHNIWIGTRGGLLKLNDISFTVLDNNNNKSFKEINNIIPLPDSRILFASATKSGIFIYDSNSCKPIMPPQSPGNEGFYRDPVDAYTFDDNHTLWMVTRFRRLLHFNGKTLEDFSAILHLKTPEYIYDLSFSKKRNQFFICADSTLLYGNPSKLSIFIPHNTGTPIVKPIHVLETRNGLLFLYVDGKGVYCINEANNFISLIKETHIDGSKRDAHVAICFYEDADNNFWIAFAGLGLYQYSFTKNKLPFLKKHFTIKDGLQSDNIFSLTNDKQNRLWIATSSGIDILQKNKAGNWDVFNYARSEELTISETNNEKLVTDMAGNVWLSSQNKIIKFNTANISLHKETPHIVIEKVSLSFKETDWSKSSDSLYNYYQLPYNPVLKYNQNSLGIFFNAVDLSTSNSALEYSYRLLPLDTSWSVPSKTKSVSFAQLPAGKYQFMVKAKDRASGWSEPAIFRFTITPAFWNSWWFRLIIIAMVAYIIISIFTARIKKIKNDNYIKNQLKDLEMKALKAQMNPHFIYNALNSIQALVASDKKTEGIHYIGSFSRLLRHVLDNSENNVISLDKELETIGLYIQLESLRLDMQLQYKKNIADNIVAEFEKIPPLILQPFIENALWHGLSFKEGKKEVAISVSTNGEWLLCDITDNGIGREKAKEIKSQSAVLHQSKAIDITRKRLLDFNENDSISPVEFFDLYNDDKISSGTQVTIRIRRKINTSSV